MNNQPIGILDSGVGGLSIWKEVLSQLPNESTVYIGDSLHAPYGKRHADEIFRLARQLVAFLVAKQVKLVVVACNTITVNSIGNLRAAFPTMPIIGTVPVVKLAVHTTKNKRIGLLATSATVNSTYNKNLIATFAGDCTVITIGTDTLVPLIEQGREKQLVVALKKELKPFIDNHIDTIILGSTHFPLIREHIQKIMGANVHILDSGGAVARQVKRVLENNKTSGSAKRSSHLLYTTGSKAPFIAMLKRVVGNDRKDMVESVQAITL